MVEVYVRLILNGSKSLDDIPDLALRKKVRERLIQMGVIKEEQETQ